MEAHNQFVERMNKAHFIITNLFVSVSVTNIKLVVITGTEEHGEIFLIKYYDGQFLCEIESLKDKHTGTPWIINVESAHEFIEEENDDGLVTYAKAKVNSQFNEMSSALLIFDKHWETMADSNRSAIWKYMKVLCVLCAKAKGLAVKA